MQAIVASKGSSPERDDPKPPFRRPRTASRSSRASVPAPRSSARPQAARAAGSDLRETLTPRVRRKNAGYISAMTGRPEATSSVSGPSNGQSATRSSRGGMMSRQTDRAKAGFRPILARDADGAVERDDGVAGQLEGGDVLDGTRRRQNVATSAQHRPAQLAFARSRPPVDRQDLAGRPAKPAHPWRRRATTASS